MHYSGKLYKKIFSITNSTRYSINRIVYYAGNCCSKSVKITTKIYSKNCNFLKNLKALIYKYGKMCILISSIFLKFHWVNSAMG